MALGMSMTGKPLIVVYPVESVMNAKVALVFGCSPGYACTLRSNSKVYSCDPIASWSKNKVHLMVPPLGNGGKDWRTYTNICSKQNLLDEALR